MAWLITFMHISQGQHVLSGKRELRVHQASKALHCSVRAWATESRYCEHDINEEEALRWASIQASTLNSSYSLNTTLVCAKMAVRHPMTPALSFYRLWCRQTSLLPHHSHMNANEYKFERAKSREHFNFGSGPGSYLFLARLIKLLSSLRWLRILCEIGLPFSSHHHLPRLLPFIRSTLQSPPF